MGLSEKKRGRITYYFEGNMPTISSLVTEETKFGDLKIYFAGLTGGYSTQSCLGNDDLVRMNPLKEVEMVFRCWEKRLIEVGICDSLRKIDFLEIHAFGAQIKDVNAISEPVRFLMNRNEFKKNIQRHIVGFLPRICQAEEFPRGLQCM